MGFPRAGKSRSIVFPDTLLYLNYMLPHWIRYIPFYLPWLALLGWLTSVSWFFTDDAFTSFRYARNLLEGHGLVFNPGEYVEGYSNFLWVLELAAIWALFDLAPEYTAQWLSVAFTAATLAAMLWWMAKLPGLAHRGLTTWMALGLVCSSATFATWTSGGGLETRQFTFFILLAVVCLSLYRDRRAGLLTASFGLVAAAYTRPEGPLIAVLCFGWFVIQRYIDQGRRQPDWREVGCLVVPCVALVAAHFLFRYAYYGEWLPNTYYAKFVRPWYELGFIYLQAAGLVTGLYLLLPLAWVGLRQRWRDCRDGTYALVFLLVAAHAGYLMRLGGDVFEWRPLDFYWPLLAPPAAQGIVRLGSGMSNKLHSFAAGFPQLGRSLRGYLAGKAQLCAVILFLPALFYANAMQGALLWVEDNRPQLSNENSPWLLAAPGMPVLTAIANELRWEATESFAARAAKIRVSDTLQPWSRYAGMEREVIPEDAVGHISRLGHISYYLPDIVFIDQWGLTDYTIARNPVAKPNRQRTLAHDRKPPPGYLEQRGVNFRVYRPAATVGEALTRAEYTFQGANPDTGRAQYVLTNAEYAVKVGDGLYLPFDSPDRQWVRDRFGSRDFTDRDSYLLQRKNKLAADEPNLQSDFAVYLDAAERTLFYVKETCRLVDTEARFFLHIYPIDPADLPPQRQVHYFDNRDFSFDPQGTRDGQVCIGVQPLPNYPIAVVRTGQFVGDTKLWEGEIRLKPE